MIAWTNRERDDLSVAHIPPAGARDLAELYDSMVLERSFADASWDDRLLAVDPPAA
jgi:hypothetical protein